MKFFTDFKKSISNKLEYEQIINNCDELLLKRKFENCLNELTKASKLEGVSLTYGYYLKSALTNIGLKNTKAAFSFLENCVQTKEKNATPYYLNGLLFLFDKNFQKALESFSLAQKLKCTLPLLPYWKGLSYLMLTDFEEAAKEFLKCLNSSPENEIFRFEYANALSQNGSPDSEIIEIFTPVQDYSFPPGICLWLEKAIRNQDATSINTIQHQYNPSTIFERIEFEFVGYEQQNGKLDAAQSRLEKLEKREDTGKSTLSSQIHSLFSKPDYGSEGISLMAVPLNIVKECELPFVLDRLTERYFVLLNVSYTDKQSRFGDLAFIKKDYALTSLYYERCKKTPEQLLKKLLLSVVSKNQHLLAEIEQEVRNMPQSEETDLINRYLLAINKREEKTEKSVLSSGNVFYRAFNLFTEALIVLNTPNQAKAVELLIEAKILLEESVSPYSVAYLLTETTRERINEVYSINQDRNAFETQVTSGFASFDVEILMTLNTLIKLFSKNHFNEVVTKLKELQYEYERPLSIVVAGEFNAGKSTFINAIIGREVVPTGIVPTTATINIIKYGEEAKIRILYKNGNIIEDQVDHIHAYTNQNASTINQLLSIKEVEVYYPLTILKNINIIDTPGFNSEFIEHDRITNHYLKSADAIIWLFNADRAGKESESSILEPLAKYIRKTVAIINGIDNIRRKSDVNYLLEILKQKHSQFFSHFEPLSAYDGLQGKLESDQKLIEESHILDVENLLNTKFASNYKTIKNESTLNKLSVLLKEVDILVTNEIDTLNYVLNELNKIIEEANKFRTRFQGQIIETALRKNDLIFNDLYEEASKKIIEYIKPAKHMLDVTVIDDTDVNFIGSSIQQNLFQKLNLELAADIQSEFQVFYNTLENVIEALLTKINFSERLSFINLNKAINDEKLNGLQNSVFSTCYYYYSGHLQNGQLGRVASDFCNADTSSNSTSNIVLKLKEVTLDIKPLLKNGLSKWGNEYFSLISNVLITLKQIVYKKECEIKQGLYLPFSSMKEKIAANNIVNAL